VSVILWIITGLALVIGAAVVLLVIHGARQAEIHQQITNEHTPHLRLIAKSPVSKENES
jgi:cytochrome c-type biogenesis protein CcmH/NrfF